MRTIGLTAMLFASACTAQTPPSAPLSSPDGEVRLRCGSDALRARIRSEGLEVERKDGSKTIVPPRAADSVDDGAAYGDGEFTFYKVRGTGGWQVEARDGTRMACRSEAP